MRGGLSKFHYSFWSEGGEQIGALDFPSGFPLTRNPAKIHVVPDLSGDFVRLRVGSRGFSIERRRQTTRIWGEDDWIFVMSDGTKTLATARIEGGGATFLVEWNGQILIWARVGSATDYELRTTRSSWHRCARRRVFWRSNARFVWKSSGICRAKSRFSRFFWR